MPSVSLSTRSPGRSSVLEMRTVCERCGAGLAPDGPATICSYECTFCRNCADTMDRRCPNCSGELVARPRRAGPVIPAEEI